jgi:hypothetical protein
MSDEDVIIEYTLKQAIADGVLVELFKNRWATLSGGKPIVVTAQLFEDVTLSGLLEIWNAYIDWRKSARPVSEQEGWIFHTTMNGKTVWVMEDGQAFTLLYPEEY